jgi:catechol 2,3-dioxygenase-like lactoylglutathione lyase family enzyme
MKRLAIVLLLTSLFLDSAAAYEKRPRVFGLAHVALFVSDLQKARAFYEEFLGCHEAYVLKREDGSERIVFIKINDQQYIELFAENPKQDGHLNHISFFTDSAERMRDYLALRGIKVPERITKGRIGNLNFNIADPDGHASARTDARNPDMRTSPLPKCRLHHCGTRASPRQYLRLQSGEDRVIAFACTRVISPISHSNKSTVCTA